MFSNQNAQKSVNLSNKVVIKIAEVVKKRPLTTNEKIIISKKYRLLIRKSAHFFLYFALSILIFALLKEFKKDNIQLILITIALCMLYAITDEVHQLFIAGRTSKFLDVMIDTAGATLGTVLSFITLKFRKKYIKKANWYIIFNRGEEIC